MKRVLVTGTNSYIGNKFKEYVSKHQIKIDLDYISVRDDSWKNIKFNKYDSILHLAGIAHVSRDPKLKEKYYKVNRDLTIQLAEKAKKEKVKQFIFMSSIIIYGQFENEINDLTIPQPSDFYGDSKLQADIYLQNMTDDIFKTAVIRTPVVYGHESKGNFMKLIKFSRKINFFFDYDDKKSMIYVDNLNNLVSLIISNEYHGVFYPQNKEYVSIKNIVRISNELMGKKIYFTRGFNWIIKLMTKKISFFNKIFGDKFYKIDTHKIYKNLDYQKTSLEESIKNSIGK